MTAPISAHDDLFIFMETNSTSTSTARRFDVVLHGSSERRVLVIDYPNLLVLTAESVLFCTS